MFKLVIRNSEDVVQGTTEHETVAQALSEFAGWKDDTLRFTIDGECTVDYACKRVLESRNRVLQLSLMCSFRKSDGESEISPPVAVELKAPQICKLLGTLLPADALVMLQVTASEMLVY